MYELRQEEEKKRKKKKVEEEGELKVVLMVSFIELK